MTWSLFSLISDFMLTKNKFCYQKYCSIQHTLKSTCFLACVCYLLKKKKMYLFFQCPTHLLKASCIVLQCVCLSTAGEQVLGVQLSAHSDGSGCRMTHFASLKRLVLINQNKSILWCFQLLLPLYGFVKTVARFCGNVTFIFRTVLLA